MQTVLLVIHFFIAAVLIGSILLQRSEGGALGIGGGGGGGFMSGRGAANSMTRLTAMLAIGFFASCILLTVLARFEHQSRSIIDSIGKPAATAPAPANAPANGAATAPAATAPASAPEKTGTGSTKFDDLQPILPADPGTTPKP
jgi:preprotein translocase subunit SecG